MGSATVVYCKQHYLQHVKPESSLSQKKSASNLSQRDAVGQSNAKDLGASISRSQLGNPDINVSSDANLFPSEVSDKNGVGKVESGTSVMNYYREIAAPEHATVPEIEILNRSEATNENNTKNEASLNVQNVPELIEPVTETDDQRTGQQSEITGHIIASVSFDIRRDAPNFMAVVTDSDNDERSNRQGITEESEGLDVKPHRVSLFPGRRASISETVHVKTGEMPKTRRKSLSPIDVAAIKETLVAPTVERRASLQILNRIGKHDRKSLNYKSQTNISAEQPDKKSGVSSLIEKFSSLNNQQKNDKANNGSESPTANSSPVWRRTSSNGDKLETLRASFTKSKSKHNAIMESNSEEAKETPKELPKIAGAALNVYISSKSKFSGFRRKSEQIEGSKDLSPTEPDNILRKAGESTVSLEEDGSANSENKKKTILQRSHAVMSKKRGHSMRRSVGGSSQPSLNQGPSGIFVQRRESNSSVGLPLHEKIKYLYKCLNNSRYMCDDLCDTWETFANNCVAWSRGGITPDSQQTDLFSTVARDLAVQCNELSTMLPESHYTSLLKKCITQFEILSKTTYDSLPAKDREIEAQKLLKRAIKLCTCYITLSACGIADFCLQNYMVPILSVQGWKIEAVGLESLKSWLMIGSSSQDDLSPNLSSEKLIEEFTIDIEDGDELLQSLSLKSKKERLIKGEKEKDVKSELLGIIKPQYFAAKSKAPESNKKFTGERSSFVQSGRVQQNDNGEVITPIDHFDTDTMTYRKHFVGQEHRNYIGQNEKFGEFAISIRRQLIDPNRKFSDEAPAAAFQYRVLFRAKSVGALVHLIIPESDVVSNNKASIFSKDTSVPQGNNEPNEKNWKHVIHMINPKLEVSKMKRIDVTAEELEKAKEEGIERPISKIEKSLQQIDEHRTAFMYKFGLMFVKDGQTNETQWFDNTETSEAFQRFCSILGDKIDLKGHTGFTGGLDTKNGNTGEKSIYTKLSYDPTRYVCFPMDQSKDVVNFEIMYHCSPLLPYTPGDEQQIQRKRHIGNDLVTVVFIDKNNSADPENSLIFKTLFDPSRIKSQFLHVYIIVQEISWESHLFSGAPRISGSESSMVTAYRVFSTSNVDVPNFAPTLADPPVFPVATEEQKKIFRSYILAKLINAENAAFEAPKFRSLHGRTYNGLLETMLREFYTENSSSSGSVRLSFKSAASIVVNDKRKSSKAPSEVSLTNVSSESDVNTLRKESRASAVSQEIMTEAKETLTAMLARRISSNVRPKIMGSSKRPELAVEGEQVVAGPTTSISTDLLSKPGEVEKPAQSPTSPRKYLTEKPRRAKPIEDIDLDDDALEDKPKRKSALDKEFLDFLNSDPEEYKAPRKSKSRQDKKLAELFEEPAKREPEVAKVEVKEDKKEGRGLAQLSQALRNKLTGGDKLQSGDNGGVSPNNSVRSRPSNTNKERPLNSLLGAFTGGSEKKLEEPKRDETRRPSGDNAFTVVASNDHDELAVVTPRDPTNQQEIPVQQQVDNIVISDSSTANPSAA